MKFTTGHVEVQMSSLGADSQVALAGQLDELTDLSRLIDSVRDSVTIDLGRVTFINSMGVQKWAGALRELHRRHVRVALRRCSEVMVQQMNMIVEAVASSRVESFFLPYLCDDCGAEASMCLELAAHLPALRSLQPPPQECPECHGMMSFADIPARYLLFVADGAGRELRR